MTLHRSLKVISALILLYCVFRVLIVLMSLSLNGLSTDPLYIGYWGLVALAMVVTLVASYRQIFKPRPILVMSALCLIVIAECLGFFLYQHLLNDPITIQFNATIKESIRQGLEDGTIPTGEGFEDQLLDTEITGIAVLKSIGFNIMLFLLPLYVNFRKAPSFS